MSRAPSENKQPLKVFTISVPRVSLGRRLNRELASMYQYSICPPFREADAGCSLQHNPKHEEVINNAHSIVLKIM